MPTAFDAPSLQISVYTLTAQIHSSARTAVYRALAPHGKPVVVKVLQGHPSASDLAQFRHQYTLTRDLALPGVVIPIELVPWQNSYALIMADCGSQSLAAYLCQRPLALPKVLEIMLQVTEILQQLHQCGIVHKDIKPANLLIHPESGQIKLIDFSLASRLPKAVQIGQQGLEGTLAYMAPEQTGRLNRGIDYRSDFYSLGVTFYELLTGRLPFDTCDPLELVHCHIARSPVPPHALDADIPPMVSAIALKLMAKPAEDRYQSCLGLKSDLDICLKQWQTGAIAPFELGQQDKSSCFLIPEKLYGRDPEITALKDAFARSIKGSTEMMLIAGHPGVGKTALVREIHGLVIQQRGYFIQGKFDQFDRSTPLLGFVQAFRHLVQQLLGESAAALAHWRTQILAAVGDSGRVLTKVMPELEEILGSQPAVPELPGGAAQNRFNLLFSEFVQVFTTPEHPLVLFIDDLQWADTASLDLLQRLMELPDRGHLLILGAYRDSEVFSAHPLMQTLAALTNSAVTTLALVPLSELDVTQLVADTLLCSTTAAMPLAQLIYQKTQGNPFFITQFLQGLYQDGLIRFAVDDGCWQCDLAQVRQQALTQNAISFVVQRLQRLSEFTQAMLKLAACLGNRFDLSTLSLICDTRPEQTEDHLWEAIQEGFIVPERETYTFSTCSSAATQVNSVSQSVTEKRVSYRFLHDQVQQAAYSLLAPEQRQTTHARIGQRLLRGQGLAKTGVENRLEEHLFTLVNQLNLGGTSVDGVSPQQLAQLNLQAGNRARAAAAYEAAATYYAAGIDVLSEAAWQSDYALCYDLHRSAAEAAYLSSEFERAEMLYAKTLAAAQSALDKAVVYRIQMTQYQLQGRNAEAIAIQRHSLRLLGWELPEQPDEIQACLEEQITQVRAFFTQQSVETILSLPRLQNASVIEMLRILQILLYAAWLDGQTTLALLAVAKMTTLSIAHGNGEMSPFGYAGYGLVAKAVLNEAATAYAFGDVAVRLCEQFDNPDVEGMTNFLFAADVHSWRRSLRAADPFYDRAYKFGMAAGNWLTVSFMMMQSGSDRLTYGKNLSELEAIAQPHAEFLQRIKSFENYDALVAGVIQPVRQLLGRTADTRTFDDEHFSEAAYLEKYQNNPYCLAWLYSVKIRHAVLFDHTDTYTDWVDKLAVIESTVPTHAKVPSSVFYAALMYLRLSEQNKAQAIAHRQSADRLLEKLKGWARDCPENLQHKCLLLEAEQARLDGQRAIALEKYDEAIALAHTHQYRYEAALANELAARFYLAWNKEHIATSYLQAAYRDYDYWGATAKLDQLKTQYGQQLVSPAASSARAIGPTAERETSPELGYSTSTSQRQPVWLDVVSVIKAAQAISQEIEVAALIATLLKIAIANAGAETGHFILHQDQQWQIVARADAQAAVALSEPLGQSLAVPQRLVYTVIRTGETAVFGNLMQLPQYASDPAVSARQIKSVLCAPIHRQGNLVGVLYLENNLVSGAFTGDRVDVLQLLTSQAAISLENAQLYKQTEDYSRSLEAEVTQKTQDLNQKVIDLEETLQQLQATQTQLIQTEKMSSLGQLVAGIAHEINNPVNFIHGNINYLNQYSRDLLLLVESYQKHYPAPSEEIQTLIEDIDLEFLAPDLRKTLESVKEGTTRIREIVLSLRNFSRLDESESKSVNVHEGIESTLTILKHRFKQPQQADIALIRDYGELPEIECLPGQLNQVFMNLISNALDALWETSQTSKLLRIRTESVSGDKVAIHIEDNGPGIPEPVKSRIFDPFFTTKPVGQGTGLGLSISYQIVEKHGGSLSCTTPPDGGTVFTIELPLRHKREQSA